MTSYTPYLTTFYSSGILMLCGCRYSVYTTKMKIKNEIFVFVFFAFLLPFIAIAIELPLYYWKQLRDAIRT